MKTTISYHELIGAWAPLADVSMALDRVVEKPGGRTEIIGFMDDRIRVWNFRCKHLSGRYGFESITDPNYRVSWQPLKSSERNLGQAKLQISASRP